MRWLWTIDLSDQPVHDVLVEADPDTSIAALASAVGLTSAQLAPGADPEAAAGAAAPFSGAILPFAPVAAGPAGADASIRLRAGRLGGHVLPLPGVGVAIGRAADNDVVLADPSVSRHQATVTKDGRRVIVAPVVGARPVLVNGVAVPEAGRAIDADDLVEVGRTVLSVGAVAGRAADLHRDGSGELAFNRPSRIRGRRLEHHVQLPGARPVAPARAPMPWAMAAVPVGAAGAMVLVTGQPTMLFMAAASPVMVFANYQTQRRTSRRRESSALSTWEQEQARAATDLAVVVQKERITAWTDLPDPATIGAICRERDVRLWERRLTDPDCLTLRVGVAERPVNVDLGESGANTPRSPPVMSPVPVAVDLVSAGIFGVAGPPAVTSWLGRWLVLQLAALRSPRDLRLMVLVDSESADRWSWLRWLPHARYGQPGAPWVMVGNDDEVRAARVRELGKEIELRQQARRDHADVVFDRQLVVVIDGAREYRTLPGMTSVLRNGPPVGVYSICLDDNRARLPEEVHAELIADEVDSSIGLLAVAGLAPVHRLLIDGLSPELADRAARALAPIVHVGGDGDETVLPTSVRLVDLLEVDLDSPDWLAARWTLAPRSTSAMIGAGLDGPFALDLKRDGPHTLIAGTTGAGKSEFLQTLVVSLALSNRPDALTFVLVDYKGAAAFAQCEDLPHTVGLVTNLDNRETERALESLDAELKRREIALRELGARDVDEAWDRDADQAAGRGLARLVVVIDEFAELVHELPEFVTGLIRIARVGRSLGVHLVLATQRPAGVVSAEMQANVGLRIAFRMATKENSAEVLGSQEAALISPAMPGRGLVRRGGAMAAEAFQSARVSGRRPGVRAAITRPPVVTQLAWSGLGYALPVPPRPPASDDGSATDMHGLVELISTTCQALGVGRNPSPWLPALPAVVTVAEIEAAAGSGRHHASDGVVDGVVLGLLDLPSEQSQVALRYRVQDGGHLLIAGAARAGRSSVVRTLIAGLARAFGPDELHLYGIDFGSAQRPMRDLPHCGAVVSGLDPDRITRLLARVQREISRRKVALAERGYGDITEQRAASEAGDQLPLPYLVVVIDTWDGLASAFPLEQLQVVREQIVKILREGPGAGISVVVTGDHGLLNDRIANFIPTRYALRLADRESYRVVGVRPATLPETIRPGRGYFGEPTREVQFALLGRDGSGAAQTAALREIVDAVRARFAGHPLVTAPFRLDVLPDAIDLDAAERLPAANAPGDGALTLLVGVGGDDLSRYHADFDRTAGFLVAGQRCTGRSTMLATSALDLTRRGVDVCVIAPRPSPAAAMAARLGTLLITSTDAESADALSTWVDARERCAVLVDDAELVHGSPLDDRLIELPRLRAPGSLALVAASLIDDLSAALRGVLVEVKRSKQGLLLSPMSAMDGAALGAGISRELLGRAGPGRALYPVNGEYVAVQLPVPPAGEPSDPGPGGLT